MWRLVSFLLLLLAGRCCEATDLKVTALLSENKFWRLLGHYEPTRWGGWRSHVDDERFFLSAQGAHDPQAELNATLNALYAPASLGDQHVQCRYPARTRWLKKQLTLRDLPTVSCPEFEAWFQDINPHHAALIFPAAYLNSPSSMFGHTLLRVDAPDTQHGTTLLSYALNFGAAIDNADNGMLYAWKGLVGGYPGLFAVLPYHEKISEYSRLEHRDLWEYSLNLTPQETAQMLEHLWELRQIRFDYFFFDENCSYRVLELLEVARPSLSLTNDFSLTAIPVDTVKAVKDSGLVDRIDYRPSRERELLAWEVLLSKVERQWAERLATSKSALQQPDFLALPAARRAVIQEAAYRLIRYQSAGQERDPKTARRSYDLLRAMQANPAPSHPIAQPDLPEQVHDSRTLTWELGSRAHQAYAHYGLRMAYHDLNDNLTGFPLGAQLEIAGLGVRQYEGGRWQLQQMKLVSIRSMTPRTDLLKPWSWQVSGGLESVLDRNQGEVLVSYLDGGAGITSAWAEELRGFVLGTARLEHNANFGAVVAPALGVNTGLLWHNAWGTLLFEAKADYFHQGTVREQVRLAQQLELGTNLGVRFSVKRDFSQQYQPVTEAGLAVQWYFY